MRTPGNPKSRSILLLAAALLGCVGRGESTATGDLSRARDLSAELTSRAEAEQKLRFELIERKSDDRTAIDQVDAANTVWLKGIVDRYGWPGISLVGPIGAQSAWILLQHSSDLEFQESCLARMELLVPKREVGGSHYALLFDRVRVRRGERQRYGSQFRSVGGVNRPCPIEDLDRVDERRATVGLPTLTHYAESMAEVYGLPASVEPLDRCEPY